MKMRSDTCIKTERLFLRQIDETDTDAIVSLRSNEDVFKFFYNPKRLTKEEHNEWFKEKYCQEDKRIDWIAVDDKTGVFIGVYGAYKETEDTIEVSYITNPKHYGCGYAAEAVSSIVEWCMKNWSISNVKAVIHRENEASVCFAKSLGFRENSSSSTPVGFLCMEKKINV